LTRLIAGTGSSLLGQKVKTLMVKITPNNKQCTILTNIDRWILCIFFYHQDSLTIYSTFVYVGSFPTEEDHGQNDADNDKFGQFIDTLKNQHYSTEKLCYYSDSIIIWKENNKTDLSPNSV
jgi:hypothetical protein